MLGLGSIFATKVKARQDSSMKRKSRERTRRKGKHNIKLDAREFPVLRKYRRIYLGNC